MQREKEIEAKLIKEVKKRDGLAIKLSSSNYRGLPDRLILIACGKVGFVEVKRKGNKPTKMQLSRHRKLKSLGFMVFVLDEEEKIGVILDAISSS